MTENYSLFWRKKCSSGDKLEKKRGFWWQTILKGRSLQVKLIENRAGLEVTNYLEKVGSCGDKSSHNTCD